MIRKRLWLVLLAAALLVGIIPIARASAAAPGVTFRRFGVNVIGPLDLIDLSGRPQTPSAVIQTNAAAKSYYVFPAMSSLQLVDSVRFYILDRSGEYDGQVRLTLETYGIDGRYHRTISSPVDLSTAETGSWISLDLTGLTTQFMSSEYLVAHFSYSNGVGGTMDIRPIFEVKCATGIRMFLPVVER